MARAPAIRLLEELLVITEREEIPVAIGGGLAVNAHGYRRETQDVDAFFRLEDRLRVMRSRLRGSSSSDSSHRIATRRSLRALGMCDSGSTCSSRRAIRSSPRWNKLCVSRWRTGP